MTRVLYSIMVAVIVMLAVPFSQLRVATVKVQCCCPDPSRCHCPDHDKKAPKHTTIKACHKSTETLASASAPTFTTPTPVVADVPETLVASIELSLSEPHESPLPDRPRGPS